MPSVTSNLRINGIMRYVDKSLTNRKLLFAEITKLDLTQRRKKHMLWLLKNSIASSVLFRINIPLVLFSSYVCLPLTKLSLQALAKREGWVIQQAFGWTVGKIACKRDMLFCVSSKRAKGAVRWDCELQEEVWRGPQTMTHELECLYLFFPEP